MKLAFAAILVTACTSSHSIDGSIDHTVTGGLDGQGDGTSLHVELDGHATRITDGVHFDFVLEPAEVTRLHDAVYSALPLDGTIGPCCDAFADTIAVHVDGHVETVTVVQTAEDVPDGIAELVGVIRSLGRATQ